MQNFSLKNVNPSINEIIHVENDYFPLPSKFEMECGVVWIEDLLVVVVGLLHSPDRFGGMKVASHEELFLDSWWSSKGGSGLDGVCYCFLRVVQI
jgi:hypothetical protein